MVHLYKESEIFYNNKKKNKIQIDEDPIEESHYFDIWKKENPSFMDVNNNRAQAKALSLMLISFSIIVLSYIAFRNIANSVIIGVVSLLIFIVVFRDQFFYFAFISNFSSRTKIKFNPFDNFVFWYDRADPTALFSTNKKDLINIVISIYQITVIPENVTHSVKKFVRALGSTDNRLPYTYQIVQHPPTPLSQKITRENGLKSLQSKITDVYFMVFYSTKGILSSNKLNRMKFKITTHANTLKSNFVSSFHHYQVKRLSGESLVNAMRTFFVRHEPPKQSTEDKRELLKSTIDVTIYGRLGLFTVLILFYDFILSAFGISLLYILGFNVIFTIALVLIWWRSLFFQYTKRRLLTNNEIVISNPFRNVSFYYLKKYPYTLFMHIGEQLLCGMKMINMRHFHKEPFILLGNFIEGLNNQNIFFSYTLENHPLHPYYADKLVKYMNDRTRRPMFFIDQSEIESTNDWENWLRKRAALWNTWLTMSVHDYRYLEVITESDFYELEQALHLQITTLEKVFHNNFQRFNVEHLKSNVLISGFLFSCLKTHRFRLNGSHFNYIVLQGVNLYGFTEVDTVLRRALPVRIATEFNTPLYLENYITIGHTINTEVLEAEVPVGFTREQLQSLLIVDGQSNDRDAICMQIVSELIKANLPSLIFDFNGRWSKLLPHFKNSRYEKEILYFKYRNAFIIDPIKSDLPYDKNNMDYLKYMLDTFGSALKKDERTIEMFRSILRRHPDQDLETIYMSLQNQPDWQKSPIGELLLNIFADFTPDDLSFFQQESIVSYNFIQNKKTVIIDLSCVRELNVKSFLAFIILSKIIHYISYEKDFHEKFIIMPYSDIFFDSYFLNLKRNYDKIDLFLRPLVENNFGLIFSANQVSYLHTNFLLYFRNYITLKTIDNRDINTLRNLINLQEIQGMGVFSQSRNQTYQLPFLRNLAANEVIIKRDDIDQPFPATIDLDTIQERPLIPYSEIVKFMATQGYDLEGNEKKILEKAKKNIFEIDLGHYYIYVEEIIAFLDMLKSIDQIGNLYRHKLEKQLKQILYPVISQKTNNKTQIKKTRDEILNLLIRQGYLVEDHPQRASGSEALRTSYSVGERYQEALQDYFETQASAQKDFRIPARERVSDVDSNLDDIFHPQKRRYIIPKKDLKKALIRELSSFHMDLFTAYEYINREDYDNALKIEHGLIKKYLVNVYRHYYNVHDLLVVDLNKFLTVLEETPNFPFTKQELFTSIDKYQIIKGEEEDLEPLTKEIYELTSDFFMKIQDFVIQEG